MTFTPSSMIWLCSVPIDNTYQNQIRFSTAAEQSTYFATKTKKTFSDYVVVRKTTPDGRLRSSVKVEANIDDLYGCNYMHYRNVNHGTRTFYCFITDLVYVSEGTTEIVYETDVYQTWMFDVQLLESYVVREHSETDIAGDNIVPEPFNYGEYVYQQVTPSSDNTWANLTQWGYLVGASVFVSENGNIEVSRGSLHSGIYQGLYFYYFTNASKVNAFLDLVETEKEDSVLFIAVVPRFSVGNNVVSIFNNSEYLNGYVMTTNSPETTTLRISSSPSTFGGYTPKNKKLFTTQFCRLLVTNHSGAEAEYSIEDFSAGIAFYMYGDVCANPSITIQPSNYKGIARNHDAGLSINNFPQCAYHSDSFKLWLAKNQYTIAIDALGAVGSVAVGGAMLATGGGSVIGGGMVVNGASKIASTLNGIYQATREPNRSNAGATKNNLLTAITKNRFEFYFKQLKPEYAKTIDDYFTMFGYQTNRVKVPNIFSRPYFNYVQTIDANISDSTFGIPCDDIVRLKKMYNDGVTFWSKEAKVGDYSVNNAP